MNFRLWTASLLAALAIKVAPPNARTIFRLYREMLISLEEQIAMGRTYGVVMAGWALSQGEEMSYAATLEAAAFAASPGARRAIEETERAREVVASASRDTSAEGV